MTSTRKCPLSHGAGESASTKPGSGESVLALKDRKRGASRLRRFVGPKTHIMASLRPAHTLLGVPHRVLKIANQAQSSIAGVTLQLFELVLYRRCLSIEAEQVSV